MPLARSCFQSCRIMPQTSVESLCSTDISYRGLSSKHGDWLMCLPQWEALLVRMWSFDGPEILVWRAAGGSECHFGRDQAGFQTTSIASSSWQRWQQRGVSFGVPSIWNVGRPSCSPKVWPQPSYNQDWTSTACTISKVKKEEERRETCAAGYKLQCKDWSKAYGAWKEVDNFCW